MQKQNVFHTLNAIPLPLWGVEKNLSVASTDDYASPQLGAVAHSSKKVGRPSKAGGIGQFTSRIKSVGRPAPAGMSPLSSRPASAATGFHVYSPFLRAHSSVLPRTIAASVKVAHNAAHHRLPVTPCQTCLFRDPVNANCH